MAKRKKPRTEVFLNIPYDKKFERLFIAYVAGVSAFGLVPRATLEIPDSSRRLNKILKLIGDCEYSIHDLSRRALRTKGEHENPETHPHKPRGTRPRGRRAQQ